jgi:hypothetical protein
VLDQTKFTVAVTFFRLSKYLLKSFVIFAVGTPDDPNRPEQGVRQLKAPEGMRRLGTAEPLVTFLHYGSRKSSVARRNDNSHPVCVNGQDVLPQGDG